MAVKFHAGPLLNKAGINWALAEQAGCEAYFERSIAKKFFLVLWYKNGKQLVHKAYDVPWSAVPVVSNPEWDAEKLQWLHQAYVNWVLHLSAEHNIVFSDVVKAKQSDVWDPETCTWGEKKSVKAKPKKAVSLEGNRVQLEEATELYQPVFGTDADSRYYVVGIADGLKLAARVKGSNVSLRVVGSRVKEFSNKLEALGFGAKEKGHWSVHLGCNHTTPQKLIGAVLLGIGAQFETGIPVIDKIVNK